MEFIEYLMAQYGANKQLQIFKFQLISWILFNIYAERENASFLHPPSKLRYNSNQFYKGRNDKNHNFTNTIPQYLLLSIISF